MNPYATARQAYTESSVMTAPPERLVVMLYDGAIRFLHQASVAMRGGNVLITSERLRRAEAIIDELNVTLDMEQGEVAANLRSIYLFCKRQLAGARVQRDADAIDAATGLLTSMREAWSRLAESAPAGAAATA